DRRWDRARELAADGQLPQAIAEVERVLALEREVLGETHARVAGTLAVLARLHEANGDRSSARQALERALTIHTRLHGGGDWRVTDARLALADLDRRGQQTPAQARSEAEARELDARAGRLYLNGQAVRGIPLAQQALDLRKAMLGEGHPDTLQSLNNLALL